jgi:hypothetical protein
MLFAVRSLLLGSGVAKANPSSSARNECELPPESHTGPNRYPEHLSRIVEAQQCFNARRLIASGSPIPSPSLERAWRLPTPLEGGRSGGKAEPHQQIAHGESAGQSYGIHGTPDSSKVSKTESHGCIRMTNWDVLQLSSIVAKGTVVDFVGDEQARRNARSTKSTKRRH